jgi:hypothetical protein
MSRPLEVAATSTVILAGAQLVRLFSLVFAGARPLLARYPMTPLAMIRNPVTSWFLWFGHSRRLDNLA